MNILVTGAAGFIGFHVSRRLLDEGIQVIGVDSINDYYDVHLKESRLEILKNKPGFSFRKMNLADRKNCADLFGNYKFDRVIHLAAQAGVRYSITHPHSYVDNNLVAFLNVLEGCRHSDVNHLVYASSSSVYGNNMKIPFSVADRVDTPISLYAATKKANELIAHTYSHLYRIPTTGLRFFTVYGPWGRPDMAMFLFTKAILDNRPIQVFNNGDMKRDFTYIDDVVEGIARVSNRIPGVHSTSDENAAPSVIYNIGNHSPVELMHVISTLEKLLGKDAIKEMLPMQPGDVPETFADVDDLISDVGFKPDTPIETGIQRFVEWYREFYN